MRRNKREKMEEAARYFLGGYDFNDVASMIGVTTKTLRSYINDKDWESVVEASREPMIEELGARALQVVKEALEGNDVATAKWFLERTTRTFSSDAKTRREAAADRTAVKLFDEEAAVEAELDEAEPETVEELARRYRDKL
jgi:hypothetical protein